jgi:hypothetical protein
VSEEERAREVLARLDSDGDLYWGADVIAAMLAFAKEQPVTVAALYGYEAGLAQRPVTPSTPLTAEAA